MSAIAVDEAYPSKRYLSVILDAARLLAALIRLNYLYTKLMESHSFAAAV